MYDYYCNSIAFLTVSPENQFGAQFKRYKCSVLYKFSCNYLIDRYGSIKFYFLAY